MDFGAGTGSFVEFSNKHNWQSEGYEPNNNAHGLKTKYITSWSNPKAYKAITAWHVIEHLPNPSDFLKRAHNSLQDSGRMQTNTAQCGRVMMSQDICGISRQRDL